MYNIANMPNQIDIGFTGEKNFRKIEINMAKWMEEMPDGVPSIVHIRPGETASDAYIASTTFADNILTWTISAGDLGSTEGVGTAQIWLEAEENNSIIKRGKSILVATMIHGAINDASESVPAAQTAWMEQMTALKVATENAASAAELATVHEPTVDGETGNWLVWNQESGQYVDTGITSRGQLGAKSIVFELDDVENETGEYTHTTTIEAATNTMKPIALEVGSPNVFGGNITVTCNNGSITVSCPSVSGESTLKVICEEMAQSPYEPFVTSEEFAVLDGRIGTLANLETTEKGSIVGAINEIVEGGTGGVTDYDDLTDKPSINSVTLSGNKSLSDLGIASASDLSAKYSKPSGGIPSTDLASGVLTSIIDDTAGSGDTDKTFSADKLTSDFSDVLNALSESNNYAERLVVYGDNRYYHDANRLIANKYIAATTGDFETYSGWSITDFIPVEPNTEYVMVYNGYQGIATLITNNYYALYNDRFEFIRTATPTERQSNKITTTAETKYIRNSNSTSKLNSTTMLVEKTMYDNGITSYIPYSVCFINDNTSAEIETISENIDAINAEIEDISSVVSSTDVVDITIETGKRYDVINGALDIKTGSNYNAFKSAIIDVDGLEVYFYTGRIYNYENQYSLIAVDANNAPLKYELGYTTDTSVTDYQFQIPVGASKLILQSYQTTQTLKKLNIIELADLQDEMNNKASSNISSIKYDDVIRSIQRIGGVGNTPILSEIGYINAYKKGFRILLCDLRFTSDNVPVLFHDDYLNQNYQNVCDSNGQLVSTDPPIYIAQSTYEDLSDYDYGLYKGQAYSGTPLMTLYDMLKLSKRLGVELYIEVKAMTEEQAKIACDAVRAYGLSEKTSWSGSVAQMGYVIDNIDTARVSIMPTAITSAVIANLVSLKTGKNKVFAFAWDTTQLTDEIVAQLIENDIAFEFGTLNSASDILNYFEQGESYYYCTGIESDSIIAGKVILENELA